MIMASSQYIKDRTVVFTLPTGTHVTWKDFLPALNYIKDRIVAFGTVGIGNVWHLTLKDIKDVELVLTLGNFDIANNILVQISRYNDACFTAILYWLPLWVPHSDVCHTLENLLSSKITCQYMNISQRGFDRCMSTQRKIQSTKSMKTLPYFIDVESNDSIYRTFLFVPGRRPLCFACGSIGHKQNQCGKIQDLNDLPQESEIHMID
jgi:hypothetical protein